MRIQLHSRILMGIGCMVGCMLMVGFRPAPLKIDGRTAKQWARFLTAHPMEARNAPPSLKQTLVPHLIHELHSNRFQGERLYTLLCWLYDYAPECILAWVPEPILSSERRLNAVLVLGELGPLAHGAVPALIPLLDNEALQCSVAFTLEGIGPAARSAVPKLLQLLSDEPEPRLATAVANLAPEDPEVIRTLAELSRTGPEGVRREAAVALKICARKLTGSLALLNSEVAGLVVR